MSREGWRGRWKEADWRRKMYEEGLRVRPIINDDFHTAVLFHFKSGRLENGGLAPGEDLWIRPMFRQTEKNSARSSLAVTHPIKF